MQVATSPEAFKKIVDDKEVFGKIMDKGLVSRVGDIQQHHTIPASDPMTALSGGVTEVYGTCFSSFRFHSPP